MVTRTPRRKQLQVIKCDRQTRTSSQLAVFSIAICAARKTGCHTSVRTNVIKLRKYSKNKDISMRRNTKWAEQNCDHFCPQNKNIQNKEIMLICTGG